MKRKYANQMGITVISIPFWWDKLPTSLAATIRSFRPDIDFDSVPQSVAGIPSVMPVKLQQQFRYKPNSAKVYDDKIDPTGW
jgi:hypothetical protein